MKYIVANWKAYVVNKKDANILLDKTYEAAKKSSSEIVVCPPNTFISDIKKGKNIHIGAQNVFYEDKGAYTGEVTLPMLKELGVKYVILGHSERRAYFSETDEMINKKVKAVLRAGLKVILCVGEKERKEKNIIPEVVAKQVIADLKGVPKNKLTNLMVAYEPIWAIGTGSSDTPENAYQAALYIRKTIGDIYKNTKAGKSVKFLYGGSINSQNIMDFVSYIGIDGVLVGGASTKYGEFKKMIELVG
jgi:triosephosphate isomerase